MSFAISPDSNSSKKRPIFTETLVVAVLEVPVYISNTIYPAFVVVSEAAISGPFSVADNQASLIT